jgi:hypothetical protein
VNSAFPDRKTAQCAIERAAALEFAALDWPAKRSHQPLRE